MLRYPVGRQVTIEWYATCIFRCASSPPQESGRNTLPGDAGRTLLEGV